MAVARESARRIGSSSASASLRMRAAVPHAAPRLPARTLRYGCALWCYVHGLDVLCGCLRFVRLRLTALGALARTSCGRCAARQTRRSLRFYVSGRASCCAKRRRSLRFYNFRRALCCAAVAALGALAALTTPGGRFAAGQRRRSQRFYDFRRALCCAAPAALDSLLRVWAGDLLFA